jgi:signal transduction histidine kinase
MIQRKNIQLDIANKKLHEKNRLKSEFISKAAHELRTPLTSIIGFAQTLLMDDIEISPQEHTEFLKMILSEGKRLNTLISDMMDLSKIELGIISLQYERFDPVSIIKETVNIFQETNHFPVNVKTDENLPYVYADKNRLKQVIMNILNNAYLYGKNGSNILITLKNFSDSIVIGVHDNGPGISPSDLPHLFDKFYRGRTTEKTRGSGLGLPICKEIIETHGGKLWIQSTPGKGTSVFFSIPVQNHGKTIN